jgi:RimJ/RimL family protein N-acetyltransferase
MFVAHSVGAADAAAREHLFERWRRQLADPAMLIRTIDTPHGIAGYVARFEQEGTPSLAYHLGEAFRGRGLGTAALAQFLAELPTRPLFARVDEGNAASLRLLERSGFVAVARQAGPSGGSEIVLRLT